MLVPCHIKIDPPPPSDFALHLIDENHGWD